MRRLFRRQALCLLLALLLLSGTALAAQPSYSVTEYYDAGPFSGRLRDLPLSGNLRADLVNVALSQLGYHEGDDFAGRSGLDPDGNGNYTEFGYFCRCDSFAWCAMFVTWCARQAGITEQTLQTSRVASPTVFGTDFREAGCGGPAPGDLAFFRSAAQTWAHVGIVIRVEEARFFTVEGNANDMVRLCSYGYEDERIVGYGSFTEQECDESLLLLDRLYDVHYVPNGGRGERRDQVAMNGAPLQLYKNSAPEEGEPDDSDWYWREGCRFGGWLVRREEDGRWLGEEGWLLPEEVSEARPRRVLPDKAALILDDGWAAADLAAFTFYALWFDETDGLAVEEESYLPRRDGTGWLNPYGDLRETLPGYEAARSLLQRGIVKGGGAVFGVDAALSAADLAAALLRLERETGAVCPEDEDALAWAADAGLLSRAASAAPETALSQPELLESLYRFALRRGAEKRSLPVMQGLNAGRSAALLWAAESGLLDAAGLNGARLLGAATRMDLCRLLYALTAAERVDSR